MKILAVSLLRLGDIVMISGVLKGLKEKNPGCELHLLINKRFADVTKLMPYVDKVITFDRERVQRGLGEAEEPLYGSYFYLEDMIAKLNSQSYDLVANFTQNVFSARLISQIKAKNKIGLNVDATGKFNFGSAWFERLNARKPKEPLHYIDFMVRGSELKKGIYKPILKRNPDREEADKTSLVLGLDYIVVQALTSDNKKNWGLKNYEAVIEKIAAGFPHFTTVLLGAPNEENFLHELSNRLLDKGIHSVLIICNLSTAFAILQGAKLVVTGDTGIKHLATATNVPIIELSLGSSDMRFTGAYSENAWIVQSPVACAPCEHRGPCKMEKHFCSSAISRTEVSNLAISILKGSDLVTGENTYKCGFLPGGMWCPQKQGPSYAETLEELADEL